MEVRRAPKFVAVRGSKAKTDTRSIDLLFRAEGGEHFAVEIDVALVQALLTTITGHANEIVAIHGGDAVQAMPVREMSVAMTPDGRVGLKMISESQLASVFSFAPEDVPQLRSILAELEEILSRQMQ